MPIKVVCPQCAARFQANDSLAGKRARCARCQAVLQVPSPGAVLAAEVLPAERSPGRREEAVPMAVIVEPASAAQGGTQGAAQHQQSPAVGEAANRAATAPKRPAAPRRAPLPVAAVVDDAPAASHARPAEPSRPSAEEILGGFTGPIEPVKVSARYQVGIYLTAAVMVVLPLVYLALIALVAWAVCLHSVHDTGLLQVRAGGRGQVMALVVYLAPMIVGALLILFMLKPLFAKPVRPPARRSLSPEAEPLLFGFVQRVCQAVGAPMPRRIDVDCEVNASASFRAGWWSIVRGNDLVLTIGLPLVAGLSLPQFAGVLAHEFGHFSQGAGMRLSYVVRAISYWFTRVVYERDQWDQRLVEWCDTDIRIAAIFYLTRLFVWLTRKVLWVLMVVGHAVAGFLLRQMEFDADRYEARLVGSDVFPTTCGRLLELNVARQGANSDLSEFLKEGRLGDNLPQLILHNVGQIPADALRKIRQKVDEAEAGWFDTHPADKDRVASARRENTPGVFRVAGPAAALFADFTKLASAVTVDYYREVLGPAFEQVQIVSQHQLLRSQTEHHEADQALTRYFQRQFTLLRPLELPNRVDGPDDARQTAARLRAARQQMLDQCEAYRLAFAEYDKADTMSVESEQARSMLSAEISLTQASFIVPMKNHADTIKAQATIDAIRARTSSPLASFETAACERLESALELLHVPQVAAKIPEASAWKKELGTLLPVLTAVVRNVRPLLELRNAHAALVVLAQALQSGARNDSLIMPLKKRMAEVHRYLSDMLEEFSRVTYPFEHAKGTITLRQYIGDVVPSVEDLGALHEASEETMNSISLLYARLVGRLVVMAEKVESLLGLPPLPEPPEREEEGARGEG